MTREYIILKSQFFYTFEIKIHMVTVEVECRGRGGAENELAQVIGTSKSISNGDAKVVVSVVTIS